MPTPGRNVAEGVRITFEGLDRAEANRAAQDLRRARIERIGDDVITSIDRDDPDSQDAGATLVLRFGSAAAVAVAQGIYTFQRTSDGAIVETTDPGRGIRSGKFADLNRFKVPTLRGLAARAPYFHNGIADRLEDVAQLYQITQAAMGDHTHMRRARASEPYPTGSL